MQQKVHFQTLEVEARRANVALVLPIRAAGYGARDFVVLPSGHAWVIARPQVVEYVAHFLEHGRFKPSP